MFRRDKALRLVTLPAGFTRAGERIWARPYARYVAQLNESDLTRMAEGFIAGPLRSDGPFWFANFVPGPVAPAVPQALTRATPILATPALIAALEGLLADLNAGKATIWGIGEPANEMWLDAGLISPTLTINAEVL